MPAAESKSKVNVSVEDLAAWTFSAGVVDDMLTICRKLMKAFKQVRTCQWTETTMACCTDNMDNDGDGKVDLYDEGCMP